jgi:hypothetical protein
MQTDRSTTRLIHLSLVSAKTKREILKIEKLFFNKLFFLLLEKQKK